MKKIKLIIGILIILSFVFAPFGTQTSVNDHNTNDSKTITAGINKISANSEKTISWDISNDSFSDVYNYNYSGWEFGPTPSYSLTYNNGTAIGLQDTIYFSDTIIIRINVPIASITSGNGLGQVGFYLSYNKQGTSGDVFDESGYYYYDVNAKTWNYYSSATNRSTGIPVTVNDPTIFNWNSQTANYNSGNNSWTVQFTGSLSSSIPSGKWNFNLQIMDSSDQIVQSYGYNSWNSQNPPYRDLWINAPYDPLSEYGDAYITNVYSNSMKPLDYV